MLASYWTTSMPVLLVVSFRCTPVVMESAIYRDLPHPQDRTVRKVTYNAWGHSFLTATWQIFFPRVIAIVSISFGCLFFPRFCSTASKTFVWSTVHSNSLHQHVTHASSLDFCCLKVGLKAIFFYLEKRKKKKYLILCFLIFFTILYTVWSKTSILSCIIVQHMVYLHINKGKMTEITNPLIDLPKEIIAE